MRRVLILTLLSLVGPMVVAPVMSQTTRVQTAPQSPSTPLDDESARRIVTLAQEGHVTGQVLVAIIADRAERADDAMKWYLMAAEQGNAFAQSRVAQHYAQGSGVPKNYSEAVKWARKAAEQDDPFGQMLMSAVLGGHPKPAINRHLKTGN